MYCVKCGTKAEKGQKLCHECGMRLVSPEALLKLLRKADLEEKLSRMDQVSFKKSEKSENAPSIIIEASNKASAKPADIKTPIVPSKTIAKPATKKAIDKKESEIKRVTPLFDNPTQPKRRSIFDDTGDVPVIQKKAPSKKEVKPSSKPAVKPASKPTAKPAEKIAINPVVKLPEKKRTVSESRKREETKTRAAGQLFFMPEHDDTKRKPAPRKNPVARRENAKSSIKQRPDRSKSATRNPASPVKTAGKTQMRSSSGGGSIKKARPKREEESFVEKYLRSIISMMLLTCTVIMMLMWGYATDSGLRTMAEFGLGSRKGYILLGDDCMAEGNYKRAVEHYYKALSKKVNYEAGIKLARAYRQTGEAEKETSALLLLMDRYESVDEPYQRILELFPDPAIRPEKVQNAINMHER